VLAQHIKNVDVKGKRVLCRVDINVPVDPKTKALRDLYRIKRVAPTINWIIDNGGIAVIATHFSDDNKKKKASGGDSSQSSEILSTKILIPDLERMLRQKVLFLDGAKDCVGPDVENFVRSAQSGDVLLLENLRINPGEKKNDSLFAAQLSRLGDIYCNDAFGVCHRRHASLCAITNHFDPKNITSGSLLRREVDTIHSSIINHPIAPMVVLIGGSKVETKTKVIAKFLAKSDCDVLLSGKVAQAVCRYYNLTPYGKFPDPEICEIIKDIDISNKRLHLPKDRIFYNDNEGNLDILDIGGQTIDEYCEIISKARTILFNGPPGYFEDRRNIGCVSLLKAIAANDGAFRVVGGGETNSAIAENHLWEYIDHVSTGGGAFLDFVAGERLPGLEAIGYYD